MGFPRQEYWNELPIPPPGDLPDPEIEPTSLVSPVTLLESIMSGLPQVVTFSSGCEPSNTTGRQTQGQ